MGRLMAGRPQLLNRTLEIHAWLLAALLVGVLCLLGLLAAMIHIHAGDVAYIAHTHRPIILVPRVPAPVLST